jgi:hypothetical protein
MTETTPKTVSTPVPPSRKRKILLSAFLGFVILYLAFAGYIWWAMCQPPERFGRVMMHIPAPVVFLAFPFETLWIRARAGQLHVGDAAPDFDLVKLDKSARIRLSELNHSQPVVLVFGSYT